MCNELFVTNRKKKQKKNTVVKISELLELHAKCASRFVIKESIIIKKKILNKKNKLMDKF